MFSDVFDFAGLEFPPWESAFIAGILSNRRVFAGALERGTSGNPLDSECGTVQCAAFRPVRAVCGSLRIPDTAVQVCFLSIWG